MPDDHDITAPFAVPFEHRVRFTYDVFDPTNDTLSSLLEPTRNGVARISVVYDMGVLRGRPDLDDRIAQYCAGTPGIELADEPLPIPGGERTKNEPGSLEALLAMIDEHHLCRRSYLVVIGGGAVLDVAGYAAAIAHRGIRLIRIPSTTLAQDDSGVGVKNGVNRFGKKNFLGAFTVPHAVINDLELLASLSDRDWRSGFSEAVKVALVKDAAFFEEIERDADTIAARDLAAAEPIIRRSALLHLRHITEGGDPFELTEARPLDFGHWSAHKLEQMSGYDLRHGEAVAIGVALDTAYSAIEGDLPDADAERVLATLRALGFTLDHPLLNDPRLLEGLEEFREHLGGRLTVSLLHAIGDAYDAHEIDPAGVRKAIDRLRD